MGKKKNIGPTLTVDGEKELDQQLDKMHKHLTTLKSEMKVVTSAFDENTTAQEKATATSEVLRKQIEIQRKCVEELTAGMERNTVGIEEDSEAYLDWQNRVNKAQAELNKMEAELRNNEKVLSGVDNELEKVDEELKDVSESSEKAEKDFSKLGTGLKATGVVIAAIGTGIVAAGAKLTEFSKDGAEYADTVLTMSAQTGIATDEIQKYQYASELVDVSLETLTKSMAKQIKSMKAVQDGTKLSVEAYDTLGVSVTNADGSLRDSDTVYWEVIEALGQMENETERDALAMQILGKSAQELNPLIEAGAQRMKELGEEAENAGAVLSEDMLKKFGAFDDELQYLSANAGAAKNALGTILLPALTELAGTGADLLGDFTQSIVDANGDLSQIGEILGATLTDAATALLEYAPDFIDVGGDIILSLADGLTASLPDIVDKGSDVVFTLTESVIDMLPEVGDAATDIVIALVDGLAENSDEIIEGAVDSVITLVEGLTKPDTLVKLVGAGGDLVVGILSGIADSLPLLIDAAPEIIFNLIVGLGGSAIELVGAGGEIVLLVIEGITDSVWQLFETGADIVEDIKDGFDDKVNEAKTWGKDLMDNFIGGIKAKWNDLTSTVAGVAQTVRDFIGFSEPEKGPLSNFHTYAPDMMMLFAQGIKENEHLITDQIAKSFDLEMAISSATGSTTSKAYNYGGFSINVYGAEGQDPNEIADAVMYKVQEAIYRKEAAYG